MKFSGFHGVPGFFDRIRLRLNCRRLAPGGVIFLPFVPISSNSVWIGSHAPVRTGICLSHMIMLLYVKPHASLFEMLDRATEPRPTEQHRILPTFTLAVFRNVAIFRLLHHLVMVPGRDVRLIRIRVTAVIPGG